MTTIEQQLKEGLDKVLDDIADEIFQISQEEILRLDAYNTGELLKSGNVNRKFMQKEIIYSAEHAEDVEFGTEPHTPPYKDILKWVKLKLQLKGKDAQAFAAYVVKKIEREGTDPQPFMRNAIEKFLVKYR